LDEKYLSRLINFLAGITPGDFDFDIPEQSFTDEEKLKNKKNYDEELDFYYNIDMNRYIGLDKWLEQLEDLKKQLDIQLKKIKICTGESMNIDRYTS
jgi:hypothetical protein